MRAIVAVFSFFIVIYTLIFIHYISFDTDTKDTQIAKISAKIKDVRPSFSFISDQYKGFVYAK
ncbi:hypothetical protein KDE12_00485 [Campylobacter sp. faydin G-105]|uniref:hypothetical protein n=1 Tax=Campylobacter anatolicus TaxID=2829105 RepID=UPI001B9526A7|nr:hypothetical protein [Campylobacter anatolicus]MBR8461331.1 hypothetical protein [Campylobacter anatolicus]